MVLKSLFRNEKQTSLMTPLLIVAAVLPSLLLCLLIYFLDKYEKENFLPLAICFGLGILCAAPAFGVQALAAKTGIDNSNHLGLLLINVFIIVAFTEELAKLIALLGYSYRKKFFNEPLDGIIYTMMIGMGFATVENLIYAEKFGMETVLIRSLTAVPAHAVFAVIMGYFVGMSKFVETKKTAYILRGFFLAVFIHGLYDFFLLQEYYDWLMIFGLITVALGILLSWRLIKEHRKRSPFKNDSSA